MIVTELKLRNFRNYESAGITLSPGINYLSGDNAQGKTNLLESLVYLSLTRSFRIGDDSLLIRNGSEFANLACTVRETRDIRLEAVIHSNGKTLSVNRRPVSKTSEFIGILNTVLFSPDDLTIYTDAPRDRRRLLDQEITKVSSGYLSALKNYRNLLKDRNSLLKQFHPDEAYLEVLEERLVKESIPLIEQRTAFINSINQTLPGYYRMLSGEEASAVLLYHCCIERKNPQEELRILYKETRQRDIEFHSTGSGIHREDISFSLHGQNVINSASQGQKRMMMLAFKLAIMNYIETISKQKAVLLLDDVLSELDRERQMKLMNLIKGPYQCVITGTELPQFLNDGTQKEFHVEHGRIREALHE
ncbi:MAG: DNA replication/repair protein RecF [Solobacterium sp.]|nr:DNA replication/repair protein RecF [Solobacterium sp.]